MTPHVNFALVKATPVDTPKCRPVNISSGEDVLSDDEAEWAWAQHQADNSPHSVAEVQ